MAEIGLGMKQKIHIRCIEKSTNGHTRFEFNSLPPEFLVQNGTLLRSKQ